MESGQNSLEIVGRGHIEVRKRSKNFPSHYRMRRFLNDQPNKVALCFGFVLVLLPLICGEVGLRFIAILRPTAKQVFSCSETNGIPGSPIFVHKDEVLGYKPKPGITTALKRFSINRVPLIPFTHNGELVYDVIYSIDAYGRRVTPCVSSRIRSKFVSFFGCSFAFGEGLNDDQTLPYHIGKYAPCYKPYNYAFAGYGPQQMLAKIQQGDLSREIVQKEGILLCVHAHIDRAIGSMNVCNWISPDLPYYYFSEDGNLVRDGTFATGRPFTSLFYHWVFKSQLLRKILRDLPIAYTDEHIELTATIVEESFRLFRNDFKGSRCYYVNLPGILGIETQKKIIQRLRQKGITCLDYSDKKEFHTAQYRIQGDGHPTTLYNSELAKLIVRDIHLDEADCEKANLRAAE